MTARVARVALPRGPRSVLSYGIPEGYDARVTVGCRILVPLGKSNRRCTAYVVDCVDAEKETLSVPLKPIADVLDEQPLFDPPMLRLFEFISSYYHAPLGAVIRCGLPAGLNVRDARVVELTEAGRAQMTAHPILAQLETELRPSHRLGVPVSQLVQLASQGLVTLSYQLKKPTVSSRYVSVVQCTGNEPTRPLRAGAGPANLLALLQAQGPQRVPSLSDRIPNHGAAVRRLVDLGAAVIEREQVFRDPWDDTLVEKDTVPTLTDAQRSAVNTVQAVVTADEYEGFLLDGVTGSGKTEVYLHVLEHVLKQDRGGIVLVPEIALTPQLAGRFRARFGDKVAVLHSGLAVGERLDQWELIRRGVCRCAVGARSAIFAPVSNLGVIIVDEEHDASFKQNETPRYHARDLALVRGQNANCPVILGSATPSLESVANVKTGRLTRLKLPERIGNRPMPTMHIVDLSSVKMARRESLLSRPLVDAVRETVTNGQQAILFLNRRGFASFLLCSTCGEVPGCPDCSISLTFHRRQRQLQCHYCGHQTGIPLRCRECDNGELRMVGTGTEQLEDVLAELVPEARVARMDRDTTRGRALQKLLNRFRNHEIDVLVGTQMVTKGHDFPKVTLVGVLLAEQLLKLPDFRASERTFQLLTQVSGRAGRHHLPGRVLVQTYRADHYSIQSALHHDSESFLAHEERYRAMRGYPPHRYLVLMRIDAPDPSAARSAARHVADQLRAAAAQVEGDVDVMGPTLAPLERIRGRTRYQVLTRASQRSVLHRVVAVLHSLDSRALGAARLIIDVDPVDLL